MRLSAGGTGRGTVIAPRGTWRVVTLLVGVLLFCSACDTTPRVATSATTPAGSSQSALAVPAHPTLSTTARVQTGAPTSLSVSCRPGEQMLGGGFAASNLFEYAAYVLASYPSATSTWTVTASAPASYFDLEAEVYCLPAANPRGLHVVRATSTSGASPVTVVCPDDTVLLGGGFQGTAPIGMSRPQGNGWQAAAVGAPSDASFQVYALCAARAVVLGQVITAAFNPRSTTHSEAPAAANAACPARQIAVGGGFEGGDLIVASQEGESSFTGWYVAAGGDADMSVFAVCVLLRA